MVREPLPPGENTHRPKLIAAGVLLPVVPTDGRVELVFDADGAAWAQVPTDLAQAVLLLPPSFTSRHDLGQRVAGLPLAVQALIERWRTVRVLGGCGMRQAASRKLVGSAAERR